MTTESCPVTAQGIRLVFADRKKPKQFMDVINAARIATVTGS